MGVGTMTKTQVQAAIVSRARSRKGKNKYTQGGKRTQVFTGWSDCSSLANACAKAVTGVDIGSYTGAQVKDTDLTTIHSGGSRPDVSRLEKGDFIYFWSPSSSHAEKVSHVEIYGGNGLIIGHGSGVGPTVKKLADYCARARYLKTRRLKVLTKTWTLGERVISLGCYGEDVQAVQRALIGLGYTIGGGGADMDCGDATDAAMRKFQKAYGLTVDGQFGAKSVAKLYSVIAMDDVVADPPALTEDDYAIVGDAGGDPGEGADAPDVEVTDVADVDDDPDDISASADGYMGSSVVNPYPIPTGTKRRGDTGAGVKYIQWALVHAGYDVGPHGIDGDFGAATLVAVNAYQVTQFGKADGTVGPKTLAALSAVNADSGGSGNGSVVAVDRDGRVYDVSSYDGDIDYVKLMALQGKGRCLMLILRAQSSHLDAKLSRNIKGCIKYGIPYAVYAYTYARTQAQGAADADLFYKRVVAAGGSPLFWVIDAEEAANTRESVGAMRDRLRDHIGHGGAIWFYSFDSRVRAWANVMRKYDGVWSARWNDPDIEPGYKDYALWQYGYANVPGIRKTTDASRLHPGRSLEGIIAMRAGRA